MSENSLENPDFTIGGLADVPARPSWVRYQVLAAACSLAVITLYIHRVGFATVSKPSSTRRWVSRIGRWARPMAAFMVSYGVFGYPGGSWRIVWASEMSWRPSSWARSALTACLAAVSSAAAGSPWSSPCSWCCGFCFGGVSGWDVSSDLASDGRLDADHRTRQGFRGDLDVQPTGKRGGLAALVWLFARLGGWKLPVVLVRRPGAGLVCGFSGPGIATVGGDAAGQCRRAKLILEGSGRL